jgi:hypothetical protein
MSVLTLETLRNCLDGFVPSVIATCDPDGEPNVSMISHVHFVGPDHVALTYQFFNKTRRNVLATGLASVAVADPLTFAQYRLALEYIETQTSGPLFEIMKAKLAGIASHSGMQGIFRLMGADLYHVRSIDAIIPPLRSAPPSRNLLAAARRTCAQLVECAELGDLLDRTLACLQQHFGIDHSMILMRDEGEKPLYTVASRGYPFSGIGSEIALGDGVIGVAAREGVPIRVGHMTSEYAYGTAIRDQARKSGLSWSETTKIDYPGLTSPESQIALPIHRCGRILGVLFAESPVPMRFWYDDEDALALVANNLGSLISLMQSEEVPHEPPAAARSHSPQSGLIVVRHYPGDNSIFIGHEYLIKGVAGAILWKLLCEYDGTRRTAFSNRELRLDATLRLPEFAENLEARLVLLRKRLSERSTAIRLEKCGRGRLTLSVSGPIRLENIRTA